ncbi:Cysteine-rich secretory protein family protein [Halorientalis regularis]|uniref:Cysteine-rich secretory protein family protein n=2 Tax=Halorientalis regularis TaxID=660518 RepID=A0A1G7M1X1_9EURY|nr:Cysteine-rich secretory protein family protein [Halorientalis regularis]
MKRALAASLLLLAVAVSLPLVVDGLTPGPDRDRSVSSPTLPPETTTVSEATAAADLTAVEPTPDRPPQAAAVVSATEADDSMALNETRLERALAAAINGYRDNPIRSDTFDGTLETNTTVAQRLSTLARNHSARMARLHLAAPTAGETTTADRYAAAGLDCRMRHQYESYLRPLSDLELVTSVDPNGANATVTANAVVERWFADRASRETLTIRNADHVGTGVATADGIVYVTVALC